jgi:imidazolonepropionase
VKLKMMPAEVITASTINPAFSLQLDDQVGTLHVGKRADFVALDLPSWEAVGYSFGGNPVAMTVKDGEPLVANVSEQYPDPFLAHGAADDQVAAD